MILYSINGVDTHCCDCLAYDIASAKRYFYLHDIRQLSPETAGVAWSMARPAAVDGEDGTGDVSGLRVGEQQSCSGEFFGDGPAAHWDLSVEEAPDVRVIIDPVVEWRAERPGSERVHRVAGSGELSSEAACELDDGALAGRVPGAARAADEPECAGKSQE